ncbi:hypothetical protein [Phyllobacterium zundukense]|uniref:hypothetical protein n=1 Tax=Phyllobacterium zundukense TaxID=1867719 RepID=UPI0010554E89|nr:hypothetical protein [Phyllobacterium zundukense]
MSSGMLAMSAMLPMPDMVWSAIAAPLMETATGPSRSPSNAKANMKVRMAECLVIGPNVSQAAVRDQPLTGI